jgi:hypothetical protein
VVGARVGVDGFVAGSKSFRGRGRVATAFFRVTSAELVGVGSATWSAVSIPVVLGEIE